MIATRLLLRGGSNRRKKRREESEQKDLNRKIRGKKDCYLSVRILSALSGTIQHESGSNKLAVLCPNNLEGMITFPDWVPEPRHDCGVYRQRSVKNCPRESTYNAR